MTSNLSKFWTYPKTGLSNYAPRGSPFSRV